MSGDDRVVGIEFDNSSFERKINETISSLDKLQTTLEKQNGKKALEDLSTAGSKFDVSNITAGIEGVSAKFLALSTIGITALAGIASKAISVGVDIAKSLTLDNAIAGFQEYETNMNSIQTILTNTRKDGTSLEQVNSALDTLNHYSDQTIYNFSEMAKNIGTFTAAGVNLDTATASIKGIANLAAASGSNSEQASSAMYQLSQAMSAGVVKAQDWISVTNAGMGGEMFQEALFNVGKLKGTLDGVKADTTFDQWTAAGNTFKGSLEKGWLTGEVLTETLNNFTGDMTEAQLLSMGYSQAQAQEVLAMGAAAKAAATEVKTLTQLFGTVKESIGSGWSQSFKIVLGDFNEAKELFTNVNTVIGDMVGRSADKRNEMLQGWKDLGGRAMLIDALGKAFHVILDVINPIATAFRVMFPPMTAQRLADLTWQFRDFIEKLQPSQTTIQQIQRIFQGLFAALEIGWTVIKETAGVFKDLFDKLTEGVDSGGVMEWLADLGDTILHLNEALVEGGGIAGFFDKISDAIKNPIPYLQEFLGYLSSLGDGAVGDVIDKIVVSFQNALPVIGKIRDFFGELKDKITDFISGIDFGGLDIGSKFGGTPEVVKDVGARFDHLKDIVSGVSDFFKSVGNVVGDLWGKISPVLDEVFEHIRDWFATLGDKLADAIGTGDWNKVMDVINVGLIGGILAILRKFLKGGISLDFGGGFFEKISGVFGQLGDTLKAMETKVKAEALIKIAIALGILTASLVVLSLIDSAALTKALVAMAVGFGQLAAMLALLDKIASDTSPVKLVALSVALILIAGALLVLSVAMLILSSLSWEEIAKGLVATAGLLGTLAIITKNLDPVDMVKAGAGILLLSGALLILGVAMKIFASMSWEEMGQGLVGVGVGLAAISFAMQQMPTISPKDGAALILIAAGLLVLSFAVKQFSELSWGEMARGFAGVGAGLLIIAGAIRLMPKDMLLTAASLLLIGAALLIISAAISEFAGMSMGEVGKGLGIMAAALVLLAVAAHAMSGALAGAAAIAIMAVSLKLLAGVLEQLAKLSLTELAIAIGALAAVFLVLGGAAFILQPVIPALMLLGVALGLIGLGFVLFGAGVAMAASGFAALAKAGDAGIKVFIKLLDALIAKIPEFLAAIASGMLDALQIFVDMLPQLMEMLVTVVTSLLDTIKTLIPEVVSVVVVLIQTLLDALVTLYPEIVAAGYALLMALLNGINDNIGDIVTTVLSIITNFIDAITANLSQITASALNLLVTFLAEIANNITKVTEAAVNIVVVLAKGIADNVTKIVTEATNIITEFLSEIGKSAVKMIEAGTKFITDIITGIGNAAEDIVTAGADALISFLQGISDNVQTVIDAGFDIIVDFLNGIATSIDEHDEEMREAGGKIALAIADGITGGLASKATGVVEGAVGLGKKAVDGFLGAIGANSPAKEFIKAAGYMADGLVLGMKRDTSSEKAAANMGNRTIAALEAALSTIPEVISGMDEFNPTITPVLDLTAVQKEAQNISGMLDISKVNAAISLGQARAISVDTTAQQDSLSVGGSQSASNVKFEQIINAPTELSTADIYRQTRNLVALAKEELAII